MSSGSIPSNSLNSYLKISTGRSHIEFEVNTVNFDFDESPIDASEAGNSLSINMPDYLALLYS